jgi:DNA-binding NarL/FixJ family response regulator
MKKTLIVEDHPIVSESLKQFLCTHEVGLQCECASTGKKGLSFLNGHHIDLIILDINLPDMSGIEFCDIVKSQNPNQKILAVTSLAHRMVIERMMEKGVNGLILKTSDLSEIIEAVKAVLSGEFYWGKDVMELISRNNDNSQKLILTRREVEILSLISDGLTNQEIAGKLFICCSTVDSHRKNLLLKFGANNTARLIKMAVSKGVIS